MNKLGYCVTAGSHPDGRFKFPSGRVTNKYTVKVYIAEPRKKDGEFTWRLLHCVGSPAMSDNLPKYLVEEAKKYAAEHGMAYMETVKQGAKVLLSDLEKLALGVQ